MKDLSEHARSMLDALNAVDAPPADVQASAWAAISARAAAGDMGPALGPEPSSTIVGGTIAAGGKAVWIVSGIVAAVGLATAVAIGLDGDEPAPTTAIAATEPTSAVEPAPLVPAPTPMTAPTSADDEPTVMIDEEPGADAPKTDDARASSRKSAVKVAPTKPEESEPTLEQEIMLMTEARAALGSGDAARAVRLFERHAKTFPRGEFAIEREVSWITALCALGRTQTATTRATKFLAKHPQSPHAAKVRASCGGQAPG
jgi:hypothetical protein